MTDEIEYMFAKIALPVPYHDYFTYRIPVDMTDIAAPGMLVMVPFGNQRAVGIILEVGGESQVKEEQIREISGLGDLELQVPQGLMQLAIFISKRYISTPGLALKLMLPPGTMQRRKIYFYPGIAGRISVSDGGVPDFLAQIEEQPGRWTYADLDTFPGVTRNEVDRLIRMGAISVSPFKSHKAKTPRGKERWIRSTTDQIPAGMKPGTKAANLLTALIAGLDGLRTSALRKQGFSASSAGVLVKHGLAQYYYEDRELGDTGSLKSLGREEAIELTLWQEAALQRIKASIDRGDGRGFLLFGVTSSGKTQVYLEAAQYALDRGKSVLVLVPEISLTPQIVTRFERFLSVPPMVWHSHLTPTERLAVFKSAKEGKRQVIIGARSAIFGPLNDLGLIVVDEEQDHSFKQDDPAPRYNARDLALERGRLQGCAVLLGSATPSVESYYLTKTGRLELLTLPQRVAGKGNPRIEIISTAFKPEPKPNEPLIFPKGFWPISEKLYQELSIRIKKKEQAIVLLNRRGYSSAVVCFECGWLGKCPDCEIGWTYHKAKDKMICHYCGKEQKGPLVCPQCGSGRLSFRRAGTERLEETFKKILPEARIVRLDSDVATRKWGSRDILDDFGRGKYQMLLGTQMVAKGHHFPNVGFVAVVNADIGLSMPDFRASERVLQLLTQAAGRAGRSERKGETGLVMVQTFAPEEPVYSYLKAHDFTGFLENEIALRQSLGYPPFRRLVLVNVASAIPSRAANGAARLKDELERSSADKEIEVLGPAPSPIFKRGRMHRYQVLLKIPPSLEPAELLTGLDDFVKRSRGMSVRIDVDPVSFM